MKTTLSRREFLKLTSSGLSVWGLSQALGLPRMAFALQEERPPADLLVCIFLRGGVDGLNMVIPQFEEQYYRLRPDIAIPESKGGDDESAIDLDGEFALHPAMRPLLEAWEAGHLAFVHATGSPDPTHSHFDAMEFMERGTPGDKSIPTGWIGRHLENAPWRNDSPLRALGMGGVRQTSLHGEVPVTSLRSIAEFHLGGDTTSLGGFQKTLAELYALQGNLDVEAQSTFNAIETLEKIQGGRYTPASGAEYPEGEFGEALMQVAQIAKAEIGLEVACIDLGGFDTHANQGASEGFLANLLEELSEGLAAFYTDMAAYSPGFSLVTMSEFGRRVEQNGSNGTDHGHGNVITLLGGGVNGRRIHTQWPGLEPENLYGPGDLQVTIDYRDVLAELISGRLGNKSAVGTIFPDFQATPVDVFKPRD